MPSNAHSNKPPAASANGVTGVAEIAIFSVLAIVASILVHCLSGNIPDADSLYHYRHAALYRTEGPFLAEFPWLAWSVVRVQAADLWYGFHLLLAPFTIVGTVGAGIRAAGILLTGLLLFGVRASLARLHVPHASVWPFVLLVAGPNVLYHFSMTRPHVLTAAVCAILLSLLLRGPALTIALASFAIAFTHLSQVWIVVLLVLVTSVVKGFLLRSFDGRAVLAAGTGVLAGWLARPHPLGAARLAWIQIVDLTLVRRAGVALPVGKELFPITWDLIAMNYVPFLILWVGAALLWAAGPNKTGGRTARERGWLSPPSPENRVLAAVSLVLSAVFFLMMLLVARRAYDLWSLFAVVFAAAVLARATPRARTRLIPVVWILLAVMVAHGAYRLTISLDRAHPPEQSRKAAEWIAGHSSEGEIVYNVNWDAFPRLFAWNQKNRYVSGMDPIFLYAYDPSFFYKTLYLQYGKATANTCGSADCSERTMEETPTVLRRDFQASWIYLEKKRNPELVAWVRGSRDFVPGYEDAEDAVFRLLPAPP